LVSGIGQPAFSRAGTSFSATGFNASIVGVTRTEMAESAETEEERREYEQHRHFRITRK
jgi:hypothetical protein